MIVLHANWTDGALVVWGETATLRAGEGAGAGDSRHPFSMSAAEVERALAQIAPGAAAIGARPVQMRLPTIAGRPAPSQHVAHALGQSLAETEAEAAALEWRDWTVEGLAFDAAQAPFVLERLEESDASSDRAWEDARAPAPLEAATGPSVAYFGAAARLARAMLADQRFVPALEPANGSLKARWQPWVSDAAWAERLGALVSAAPASARAAVDGAAHDTRLILESFLWDVADAIVRRVMLRESMGESIEGRKQTEPAVAWLGGLLGRERGVGAAPEQRAMLSRSVGQWLSQLEDRGEGSGWRLCFRVDEPQASELIPDLRDPGDRAVWRLSFHLESVESAASSISAQDVWSLGATSATVDGRRVEAPQELLLAGLARASRIWGRLERALEDSAPVGLDLSTDQAYEFLREIRPLLLEQGFGVVSPEWWDSPSSRLGARLQIDAPPLGADLEAGAGGTSATFTAVGLDTLVNYQWQIAVGETTLTLKEFEMLAAQRAPLVRVDGQWVEIRAEDVAAAVKFIRENPGGSMRITDALRLASGAEAERAGVAVLGMQASGWVAGLLGQSNESLPILEQPAGFRGALRPYQVRGLSWLSFLDRFGLGACLADDMGLGKTVQLLALLVLERERAGGASPGPTLVVCPMSVVSNWVRETKRFAPALRTLVHHGADRRQGEALLHGASDADVVVTTYALAHRDRDDLARVQWRRVALDEAQNIKNPWAKQSTAVRSLSAGRRIALTGTPVENRLSELWSIMDFCNPGLLGSAADFRKRFAAPIERHHSRAKAKQLRSLVQPFVLRRLKTDPNVTADLPAKVETRQYCRLTAEQASLYESTVRRMLAEAEQTEGIQRRGVVLASLVRLKQICNHPSQFLKDHDVSGGTPPDPARSGKCQRLIELLDEALAAKDQALVFTQFRQMAIMLASMLSHSLDREVLLLHGGTPAKARQQIIDRFQKGDGSAPILILSLKAGGVGLNLTAANHVFHFDRWWNPAVENQATDRAHRIGQSRTVQVHKFVVSGTLEDKIDALIEQKTELAQHIIASSDQWITELSTAQLRDLVALGPDAVADAEEIEEGAMA